MALFQMPRKARVEYEGALYEVMGRGKAMRRSQSTTQKFELS